LEKLMQMWCGIDWAEHHHDVAIIDETGQVRARLRIADDAAGFGQLLELLATHRRDCAGDIPIAIETAKGLLVANLRAAGMPVFAINPLSVSRYRDRHSPSRAKSDAADALVLAHILRTDAAAHRRLPEDSELAGSIRVLARAHQDAIWDRMQAAGKLRSLLREYYPTFLAAFDDLPSREARATLHLAASPADLPRLRKTSLVAALRRAGRRRGLDDAAERILARLRTEQLRQPPKIEAAMAVQARGYARVLDTIVDNIAALEAALETAYSQHPDAAIISSFPGLGTVLGARMLGEIGDDRARFSDARGLKAFAGTAPVTRASGMKTVVTMRVVRNKRLGQAAYLWALPMLAHSTGARAHYDRRRAAGDSYSAAARNLTNRGLGMLHHCIQTGQHYDETKAFPPDNRPPATSRRPLADQASQEAEAPTAKAVA
jgi:transposase